jgi:hypothetical protein
MSSTVFILGAGASKQCGAPLMNDFLDQALNLYLANNVENKKPQFEDVFKARGKLQAVHSKAQLDLDNIESIFSTFEMANILGKLPSYDKNQIPNLINSLKDLIVVTLERSVKFPVNIDRIRAPEPYDSFAKMCQYLISEITPKQTLSIITFNYDIAADMALCTNGLGPYYGFPEEENKPTYIPLLKLHGSLNWGALEADNSVKPLHLRDYLSNRRYISYEEYTEHFVPIGSQLKEYFNKNYKLEVKNEPVIVPPSWNKFGSHQALSCIWEIAAKELGEAEYIFIIGYSLPETDEFFKQLFALGTIGDKLIRKIVVYNPDSSGVVKDKFRKLLGPGSLSRFTYEECTFQDSINKIEDIYRI